MSPKKYSSWQWDTAIRQKWNASILSSVQLNFFEPLYFVNQLLKGLNHLCRLRDIITKMFSQFPVEGSLRLVDASSEVKEVPVLEIRCPTYSTSSSPNSVFHGAAPILCEYCPDTHHPKLKISIHRRYISHIYPANTLLAMLCWKKEPELLTRFHSNRPYWVMKAVLFLWVRMKRSLMITCQTP